MSPLKISKDPKYSCDRTYFSMKKKSKVKLALMLAFLICSRFSGFAQNPHILVNDADKQAVLNKIKEQVWAKNILEEISQSVTPYVERHATDPQWILSRYLMNRIPGKHYTRVFADDAGSKLTSWTGNAPFPTVRVSTYLRAPITVKGTPLPETQHR